METIKTSDLKEYAYYLLHVYVDRFGGKKAGLYYQLNQFIEKGRIKDIFSENTKQESKVIHLEFFKQEIENFGKYHLELNVKLKTFDEFMNSK